MNILYLSADRGIPIRGHKGAAVHVRMLIKAWQNEGHQVTLVTARPGDAAGPAVAAQLVGVPEPKTAVFRPSTNPTADKEQQAQAHAEALYQVARAELTKRPFAFIYERYSLWSNVGARLSQETGLPLILELNAPLRLETTWYRELVDETTATTIEQQQFQAAHKIVAVSAWLADYAVEQGADRQRVTVLPNAVDPQQFHPAVRGGSIHHRYGLHDKIIIGFVGRPRPWHDLPTLFAAVAQLRQTEPRYHLLLVGQMPADIDALLAAHGLQQAATVTGAVPHADVATPIAAMMVAVSPHRSLANFYYSPLKLFEYLACGVPTVAANAGQQGDIIQPGNTGYLYPPGNARALAAYIRKLVNDPELAREIAWQGATAVLQNHTWPQNARAIIKLVEPTTVVNAPAPPLPILDDKLRQRLYRATRPDLAHRFLGKHLPFFGKKGRAKLDEIAAIELFKHKPRRRCVIGYRLNGRLRHNNAPVTQEIIGKLFRDERGQRLLALQAALWHNGFGSDAPDEIYVPEPLAYIRKMRMLVQAKSPGKTLDELVQVGHITPFISRCAEGLAKLHNARLPQPAEPHARFRLKPYTLTHELTNLATFANNLASYQPDLATEAQQMYHVLLAWGRGLGELETAVPIHRDFYYSQVLFDGLRLTLIDFDLLALGDPALDVANFTAHLYLMGLEHLDDLDALAAENELFKESYGWYRFVDDSFWERVAFYETATLFRLLQVVAPRPTMSHMLPALLNRTRAALTVLV